MAAFELGEYYRVPAEIWTQYFEGEFGDFFKYGDYYYILVSKYDEEEDEIIANDLLDYLDYYAYFSSSIHFGE